MGRILDDRELIQKILQNDNHAFDLFIKKYQKLVYYTCYRLLSNKSIVEDIVQEVFIEVFRSIRHLRNLEDLSGWLFRIAYNKSLSQLRKKNPAKASSKDLDTTNQYKVPGPLMVEQETPASKMESEEARQVLFKAIDLLPPNQKKVLLMHKFDGYSQKEICTLTKLSPASVESLIYRAKTNLRKSLVTYFKNK